MIESSDKKVKTVIMDNNRKKPILDNKVVSNKPVLKTRPLSALDIFKKAGDESVLPKILFFELYSDNSGGVLRIHEDDLVSLHRYLFSTNLKYQFVTMIPQLKTQNINIKFRKNK